MDDRKWAARWVGWEMVDWPEAMAFGLYYEVPEPEFADVNPVFRTDADLAEAVRVKVMDTLSLGASSTQTLSDHVIEGLAFVLMTEGPIAFIAAVREVVDGR